MALKIFLTVAAVGFIAWGALRGDETSNGAVAVTSKCLGTTAQCAFEQKRPSISVACMKAIETKQIYQYRWLDGFTKLPFERVGWENETAQELSVAGDALEVQNQFGAFVRFEYLCTINLTTLHVVNASSWPGRLSNGTP